MVTWKAAAQVPHLSPKWLSKNEQNQQKKMWMLSCIAGSTAIEPFFVPIATRRGPKKNTGKFGDRHIGNNALRSFPEENIWFVQRLCFSSCLIFSFHVEKAQRKKQVFGMFLLGSMKPVSKKKSQILLTRSTWLNKPQRSTAHNHQPKNKERRNKDNNKQQTNKQNKDTTKYKTLPGFLRWCVSGAWQTWSGLSYLRRSS